MEMFPVWYLDCCSLFLQVSERIQTNTERLGYCVALWNDLKSMEQDMNQWAGNSIADLTDSVTNLSDKEQAEAHLAIFQVRACMKKCLNYYGGVIFRESS